MPQPYVSVIVPNYNHAKFLEERLNSILNQTYQKFELIILDDKSTDNSLEVINKYRDNPHISHIIINEENSGSAFKQWDKGISLAKGELIWIAESDDSCSTHFLEKLIPCFSSDVVLSFCRSQKMDKDGRLLTTWHNEILNDCLWDGKDFIKEYLGKYNIITNASSVLFKREFALNIPKDYLSYKGAGDWLFWIELSRKGKVAFTSEALNYFRSHDSNTTSRCYSNGDNYFEGKNINEYLLSKNLISQKEFEHNKRININRILNLTFESADIKTSLLNEWGYDSRFKLKVFLSKVLGKLNAYLWD